MGDGVHMHGAKRIDNQNVFDISSPLLREENRRGWDKWFSLKPNWWQRGLEGWLEGPDGSEHEDKGLPFGMKTMV